MVSEAEPLADNDEYVLLMDMPIINSSTESCAQRIMTDLDQGRGGWVITPNVDILRRWNADPEFQQLARQATMNVADGMPLVWASRIRNTPLQGRVNGTDLVQELCRVAAERGKSVYFLGGNPGTAEKAAENMRAAFAGLKIAGTDCPEFGFERNPEQMQQIRDRIRNAAPDILFVGLGCPKQERLIDALRDELPGSWWLGVGVSFSFLAGEIPRAPRWMQHCGLEWLHRLTQEPGRLAKRYLVDLPVFARLLFHALRDRFAATRRNT